LMPLLLLLLLPRLLLPYFLIEEWRSLKLCPFK